MSETKNTGEVSEKDFAETPEVSETETEAVADVAEAEEAVKAEDEKVEAAVEEKEETVEEMPESKDDDVDDEFDEETLAKLYEQSFQVFEEGEMVKGLVLAIYDNTVLVDIGYKSEGLISKNEFTNPDGSFDIKVGDEVEVLLEATENIEGQLVLSKDKAEKMKVWDDIEDAYKNNEVIKGKVIDRIKGGLAVDVGVRAFLPGSQVDVRPVRNLDVFKGEEIRVKVIKLNKRRGNIVLSRKEVIEAENFDRKQETLKQLEEGTVVKGSVKNITEYGAFIDLGGIDGLLHITDMSWGRINHPSELFNVGDEIEVVVLKFDKDTERVSLGYKQRWDDPWEKAAEKYPIDSRISGKIVSITDYGAFIELEEGVEGLIHVSEMSWSKRVKHPSKLVNVGEEVEAVILAIDSSQRRISLGLKQVEPNPWVLVQKRYREGDIIKGKVRNITDFGCFIEIDEGIDGLIHVSDMSWTKRIKHPSEVIKKGEEVEAIVLNIDVENQRLSLGLKQMTPNTWEEFFETHKIGEVIECNIVRSTNFGLFVGLGVEGVEGLIHTSELDLKRGESIEEKYKVGDSIKAKIIKMDQEENKIGLSVKAIAAPEEKVAKPKQSDKPKTTGKATLGDIFGDILTGGTEEEPVEAEAADADDEADDVVEEKDDSSEEDKAE